jgi:Holliday junction resolvase
VSYSKGRQLEYAVKGYLQRLGWYVIRSAGSHGVADLVAFKREHIPIPTTRVWFIQVSAKPKPAKEVEKLVEVCNQLKVTPVLVFSENRKRKILVGSEVAEYLDAKRLKPSSA